MNEPGFNLTQFLAEHGPETTDPLIDVAVKYLKDTVGVSTVVVSNWTSHLRPIKAVPQ